MPKDSVKERITIKIPPRPYERDRSAEEASSPSMDVQKNSGESSSASKKGIKGQYGTTAHDDD